MNQGLAIRSAVTLFAVGCAVYTAFLVQPGRFPFNWRAVDAHTIVVEPRPDRALPATLRSGDRIDLREQDLGTRAALYTYNLPGESYVLRVERNGGSHAVALTRTTFEDTDAGVLYRLYLLLVLVLGLTTLWWGRDWAAWGLSLFAISIILNFLLFVLPLPPVAGFITVLLNQGLVAPLITAGLYLSALTLSGPGLTGRGRFLYHLSIGTILIATAILSSAQTAGFVALGNATLAQFSFPPMLFAASISIPVIVLVTAYPRVDTARRLRLRWIISSLALFLGATAWNNLSELSDTFTTRGPFRQAIWWSAILCGLAGLLYGVLRKRVVAMSFAVNRALVYGLVVAFVIGVFAVLAAVVENTAIGRDAGLALTVVVSLAVGFVLETLRDRINLMVERLFFRQRYEAETALRRFAHQCAYVERPGRLLDEAEEEIHRHIRPRSSAFYEASPHAYRRVRQRGEAIFPERIDLDDRAFIALRADREPVDLATVRSVLGNDGYAFPMAIRGELRGALVCGSRTGEYTHDERRLLAEVAQQVGTALHALRARDHETLVDALAGGTIDLSAARQRARALRGGSYGSDTGTSSSSRKDAASTSTELPPTNTSNSPASAP
jgi:hypothetical protein